MSVGYRISAMRPGDQLWPYENSDMQKRAYNHGSLVLILRPQYDASEVIPNGRTTHHLIGCGWVLSGYERSEPVGITLINKLQERGALAAWEHFKHTMFLV